MINQNAEDPEKAKNNAMWMRVLEGSLNAASEAGKVGTNRSPIGAWAEGAKPALAGYMSDIDKINTAKNDKVKQLLALGLTGEQLKMEAKKIGISEAELPVRIAQANAQIADINNKISEMPGINQLRGAQANQANATADYMRNRPTAGLGGGISNMAYFKLEEIYNGYKAMPTSAPFFSKLPPKIQDGLTKYGRNTSTYKNAMSDFENYADAYKQAQKNEMSALNRKSAAPTFSETTNPFE